LNDELITIDRPNTAGCRQLRSNSVGGTAYRRYDGGKDARE